MFQVAASWMSVLHEKYIFFTSRTQIYFFSPDLTSNLLSQAGYQILQKKQITSHTLNSVTDTTKCTPPPPPPDQSLLNPNQTDSISQHTAPYPGAPLGSNQLLLFACPTKYFSQLIFDLNFFFFFYFVFLMLLPTLVDLLFIVVLRSLFFICIGLCTTDDQ